MLSDEEIHAIDLLKSYENKLVYEISEKDKKAVKTILNLIEKQFKEIEELKITNKELTERVLRLESDKFWNNVVSKDKIKAKIEDILNSENSEAIEKLIEWQSLLEKE